MPELPDVEGFRRVLERHGMHRRIRSVEVLEPSVLRNAGPDELTRALRGRRIAPPHRHGKWLMAHTDGPTILFHFGMTGSLEWAPGPQGRHRHDRLILVLEDGELRFRDQRKLQGVWLARDDEEARRITGPRGPDALDLTREQLAAILARRRGGLKALLMDQHVVAGLGNLLVDEILWRARLHPNRQASTLDRGEVRRLHRALVSVLEASVEAGPVPPPDSWLTGVRDDVDPRCPRCRTILRRSRTGGRGTWWCPRCQPPPG